jgi:hypothetical protein
MRDPVIDPLHEALFGAPEGAGPTIPANRARVYVDPYILRSEAEAIGTRAFWRGVFVGVVGLAALGGLAVWLS